jgi:hypothetical protein
MKKNRLLPALLIIIGMPLFSQNNQNTSAPPKMELCDALVKIIEQSQKSFSDIMKVEDEQYSSKIDIVGATSCKFRKGLFGPVDFEAEFGTFNSEPEAMAKVDELKKNISVCFPFIEFGNVYDERQQNRLFNLISTNIAVIRCYSANFSISGYGNVYTVSFHCPSQDESTAEALIPLYCDYEIIRNRQINDPFSIDLHKLMEESKNGFINIKGDRINTDNSLKIFSAKISLGGIVGCRIEESDYVSFIIPCIKGVNSETVQAEREKYLEKIKAALGNQYAFYSRQDLSLVNFININQPEKVLMHLAILPKQNETYDLNIRIDKTQN